MIFYGLRRRARRGRRQVFHKFLDQFVKAHRLIEEDGVCGVLDLFQTRMRNLARARLLASQFVRFRGCDDQSRTINLFQRSRTTSIAVPILVGVFMPVATSRSIVPSGCSLLIMAPIIPRKYSSWWA